MEWKNKIEDECCADELEEMIIDHIKAGFLSNDEILEDFMEYIEEDYPDECDNITEDDFLEIIEMLRKEFQNAGNQENFLKLDLAFTSLMFVVVLISGIIVWWPRTRKALKNSLKISGTKGWKRFWYDLQAGYPLRRYSMQPAGRTLGTEPAPGTVRYLFSSAVPHCSR